MTQLKSVWSQEFLNEAQRDWALCFVSEHDWRSITASLPNALRIFGRFEAPDGATFYCPLGVPVNIPEDPEDAVYLPFWLLDRHGLTGCGETLQVSWVSQEAFPHAQRILLRPHDTAFFHGDAREEMEQHLTRLGVVQAGETLLLPMSELGGFAVAVYVASLEPDTALMQGEEVALEFEESVDTLVSTPPIRPQTPEPAAASPEPMIPAEAVNAVVQTVVQGRRLGGETRSPLSDGRPWNPYRQP